MCCRTSVRPLDLELAIAVLLIGKFEKLSEVQYRRVLPEEGTYVEATFPADTLSLAIVPAVSTFAGHLNKRHAAGVCFEIAAKYAEKVAGTIIEHANIAGCILPGGGNERLLAVYPDTHLDFSQLCPGWQSTFMDQVEGEEADVGQIVNE